MRKRGWLVRQLDSQRYPHNRSAREMGWTLRTLQATSRVTHCTNHLEGLVSGFLKTVLTTSGAQRVAVVGKGRRMGVLASQPEGEQEPRPEHPIVQQTLDRRLAVGFLRASADGAEQPIACVALKGAHKVRGSLWLERPVGAARFTTLDLEVLVLQAEQLALAMERILGGGAQWVRLEPQRTAQRYEWPERPPDLEDTSRMPTRTRVDFSDYPTSETRPRSRPLTVGLLFAGIEELRLLGEE